MSAENEETDYGCSSDSESYLKHNNNEVLTSQNEEVVREIHSATSTSSPKTTEQNVTECIEGGSKGLSDEVSRHSDANNLIKWAARLELESLTLKEIMNKHLGEIFDENHNFLIGACSKITDRLCCIENALLNPNQKSYTKPASKNLKGVKKPKIEGEKTESHAEKTCKGIEQIPAMSDTLSAHHGIKDRATNEASRGYDESSPQKRTSPNDEALSSISELKSDTKEIIKDIASVKQFLQILVPRFVSMEKNVSNISNVCYQMISSNLNSNLKAKEDAAKNSGSVRKLEAKKPKRRRRC